MSKTEFQKAIEGLAQSTKGLITQREAVEECNKRKQNMTLRKLQLYITKKIIPSPIYMPVPRGKMAYYEKDFIIEELTAAHSLKTIFHRSIDEIAMIANNKKANLQDVVAKAYGILDQLYSDYRGKKQGEGLAFMFVNQKVPQRVIDIFLEKVAKGVNINTMDYGRFIQEAFDKIDEKEV